MSDTVAAIEEIQLPPSSSRVRTHQSAEASDRQVHAHPDKSRKTAAPVPPGMRLSIPSPTRIMLTVYKIH
jgi:hypothetical protein